MLCCSPAENDENVLSKYENESEKMDSWIFKQSLIAILYNLKWHVRDMNKLGFRGWRGDTASSIVTAVLLGNTAEFI